MSEPLWFTRDFVNDMTRGLEILVTEGESISGYLLSKGWTEMNDREGKLNYFNIVYYRTSVFIMIAYIFYQTVLIALKKYPFDSFPTP